MSTATSTSAVTELGGKYVLDRTCTGANGASTNVTGGTGSIFLIQINNEANSSASFLKIRDNTTATPGTTTANGAGTPDFTFKAPAHSKITYAIPGGAAFGSGLSMWCVTGTEVGNSSDPASSVIVKLITS
tara:strand:- start:1577 stop:1969 length:393 start_codon:yes stop_codon:yes gene_type:complete